MLRKLFTAKVNATWLWGPWGIAGGLFGSATMVTTLNTAYMAGWIAPPYLIFFSFLLLCWGLLFSKEQSLSRRLILGNDATMKLLASQHKMLKLQQELINRLEERIKLKETATDVK